MVHLTSPSIKVGSIPEQTNGKQYGINANFPLVLTPANGESVNFISVQEYLKNNNENIMKAVSENGAVLFRGFDIRSAEEFSSLINVTGMKELPYVGGAAVRKLVVGTETRMNHPRIFTTNESPPTEPIPFHNELAQTPNPPSHIAFFCRDIAEGTGGATPIIRCDLIYNFLKSNFSEFLEKLEKHGVKYVRTVPEEDDPTSAVGRSWKSMFHVETRDEAEKAMEKQNMSWKWFENGNCTISTESLPAVRVCSNGNKSFMNQVVAAYTGWVDKRNNPVDTVILGNGTRLPVDAMNGLIKFMNAEKCAYQWKAGDFILIDNTVAAHSRQPFTSIRKVVATIGNGYRKVEDTSTSGTGLVLHTGDVLPSLGLGCWKIPKETCADTVYQAIVNGYRCFDEACDYGNEMQCGEGISKAISEGIVEREKLFITSKLWNTYHRQEHVEAACRKSLEDLGLDYLDLYLIHFPIAQKFVPFQMRYPPEWIYDPNAEVKRIEFDSVPMFETWAAMEKLVEKGLVRNIGLCNVGVNTLRDVLTYAKIKPSVLQVEMHPYNTQEKLLKFCRSHGIAVTAFSNLGAGSYIELGMAKVEESCLRENVVVKFAQHKNKTPAQIVLRWAAQRGTALIPKSTKVERLIENRSIFDFELTSEEMQAINNLNKNKRFNDPGVFCELAFQTYCPIYE